MKIRIQITIEHDDATLETVTEEIGYIQPMALQPETIGLSLNASKQLLGNLQEAIVKHQIAAYIHQQADCPHCEQPHRRNGHHHLTYRTLFGKLKLHSPRFYTCPCQPQTQKSFSPLTQLLPERSAPELCYLQTKWASLMSCGMTTDLLEEVLPLKTNYSAVYTHTHATAQRIESELGEEQFIYPHGSELDRHALPHPDPPLIVGIDGGYIHGREGKNRKAGWFEAIVGKSMPENTPSKRFGYVTAYDTKPKRRLYETLHAQGMQLNQSVTFLSDGGDNVRNLQFYLSPVAEHILDWFHVTMRLTVMLNTAKGLPNIPDLDNTTHELERVKWYLWHGNVFQALEILPQIEINLAFDVHENEIVAKLYKLVCEFTTYIRNNRPYIPNYGDRYRNGEVISSAFVESTVNELISRRMSKKQQMRWTKEGAHLLLQTRVKTLNNDLRDQFVQWYPAMASSTDLPSITPAKASISC